MEVKTEKKTQTTHWPGNHYPRNPEDSGVAGVFHDGGKGAGGNESTDTERFKVQIKPQEEKKKRETKEKKNNKGTKTATKTPQIRRKGGKLY